MNGRLNAHVIFSDQIQDQLLRDFLSMLRLELVDLPLSEHGLKAYARRVTADLLAKHGFKKADVDADDAKALEAGCRIAEIKPESYKTAIKAVPDGMAIGFMPFTTNDGLDQVDVMKHYAYAMSLFESSPIFEARDDATWHAFVGRRTEGNARFFDSFQDALGGVPRLPVSGSDAHQFTGDGTNDARGYGDYPSGRITWIKADPTWAGLRQAVREPEKRCHIGTLPPKLARARDHKTFYIDRIELAKVPGSTLPEKWFDGVNLQLNKDLVAIIGNKGSGKSALADVIAVLGNSQEKKHFSFLKRDRFRGKSGEPARQFNGRMHWLAGDPCEANLADDPPADRVQLVKYIPQGRFEALCNDHASGASNAFERELRDVIFSHTPADRRLDAMTFEELIEQHERIFRERLGELRKNLGLLNQRIVAAEDRLHPDVRSHLEEQLRLKRVQLAELNESKPIEVPEPSSEMTGEQQAASDALQGLAVTDQMREEKLKAAMASQQEAALRRQAARAVKDQVDLFEGQFNAIAAQIAPELAKVGLAIDQVITLKINRTPLTDAIAQSDSALVEAADRISANGAEKARIEEERAKATRLLNEPQRLRQDYLGALRRWEEQLAEIRGGADVPDSELGLVARIEQVAKMPEILENLRADRDKTTRSIFAVLEEQRQQRADLFTPLQKLIAENALIREEYKLQFQSNLAVYPDVISENLFGIVKQSVGELRGDDESRTKVKEQCDKYGFATADASVGFVAAMEEVLTASAKRVAPQAGGVRAILRKDRKPEEVYDYLYGLDYIEPKYTLLFQNTPIEQLSPGQRGALLLIFYLLVDKGRNPIILDQPEENLDNETIVSLLVPVINEAKKTRQIIMVTHNPNLAVVCDAEQIIAASFDRRNQSSISYYAGSIEDARSNENVVTILEGTKPAFQNRSQKYL
ncbi:AAA domain-containing protein, putative AbiEii toxin, Type IV TA system [Caenispirillum bisanense]|uniref:AAA domain-containing protein, putative AbiEii toxin, Type IV TA system n=2 Tax=Caenispirillum bisanense TaxID=414052 RepID=A0A286GNX0_9PROT|nr:AAA domain-containing protein, putative AbiEii toxin, Type IV TA system [Caenispirillum bisanense]